jgi:phasin family protein
MPQPQAEMLDLYRAGLKSAADLLKTSLENAERLQNQQLVAIRTAIVEQSKSASELGSARTIDELLSAQSRLAGAQLERAFGFWTELCQVAGQNQMEAIGQMQQHMARIGETMAQAVSATASAKPAPMSIPENQMPEKQPERREPQGRLRTKA